MCECIHAMWNEKSGVCDLLGYENEHSELKWDSNMCFQVSKIIFSTWSFLKAVLKRPTKRGFCHEMKYKHIFGWIKILKAISWNSGGLEQAR